MKTILITGAAGNLGCLLARHILEHERDMALILMQHRKKIPAEIASHTRVKVRYADLELVPDLAYADIKCGIREMLR